MTQPWVVTEFNHWLTLNWYIIQMTTNVAFTAVLQYSTYPPRKYTIWKINRGVRMKCGFEWRLWRSSNIPDEGYGPQYLHTFNMQRYPVGTYIWFRMKQTYPTPTAGKVTPIFMTLIPSCPVLTNQVAMESLEAPPKPPGDDEPVITEVVTYVQV